MKKNLSPGEISKKLKGDSNIGEISRFLYNFGLEKSLLKLSIFRLKDNKPVAWAYVLKVLIKHKLFPDKKLEQLLFSHWLRKKENQALSLFACEQWGDLSPEFQQLSQVYLQDMEEKNLSKEKELLEQLAFVQAQDLVLEEEEIIAKLLLINPSNEEYKTFEKALKEKKALLTIQEQKNRSEKKDNLLDYDFNLNLDDIEPDWLSEIFKTAKKRQITS